MNQVSNTSETSSGNVEELANLVTNWIPPKMIDMITKGSAALGAYGATITEKYLSHIDFTIAISTQPYTFLLARPKELSRALLFMAPFSGDVSISNIGSTDLISMFHLFFFSDLALSDGSYIISRSYSLLYPQSKPNARTKGKGWWSF